MAGMESHHAPQLDQPNFSLRHKQHHISKLESLHKPRDKYNSSMAALPLISRYEVSAPCTLESLPLEILNSILDFAIPDRPEIGESKPVSYNTLVPEESWYHFTRSRFGLRSLCLVSRRFRQLAQPLLYRVVAILNEESLVLFLRAVLLRPDLVSHTRHFSCHLTLTRLTVVRQVRHLLATFIKNGTMPMTDHVRYLANRARPDQLDAYNQVPELILCFILVRLPRLETLLLQVPICSDHEDYFKLIVDLAAIKSQFPGGSTDVFDLGWMEPPPKIALPPDAPFTHLEALLLQGDPEVREEFENEDYDEYDDPGNWGVDIWAHKNLFTISPKLATLEVSCDNGEWNISAYDPDPGNIKPDSYNLGEIRHIYLHESISNPRELHHILKNAPKLETLYMTPRLDNWASDDETLFSLGDPDSLDDALQKHAKNLRHLDVAWFDMYGHESLIGPEGRLASLPTLTKLEKLCVQLVALYGTDLPLDEAGNGAVGLLPPIADLLPPNLTELTLEDWWWSNIDDYYNMTDFWGPQEKLEHYRAKRDYRENALKILTRFAADSAVSQPRLKKVLLLTRMPCTWMMENGVELDFHFQDVKQLFGARGVEFLVDEAV